MRYLVLLALVAFTLADDVASVDQTGTQTLRFVAFYSKYVPITFGVESGNVKQTYKDGEAGHFYQLTFKDGFQYSNVTAADPLILWLNGGPGCASQFGLYGEIGPFVVTNDTTADTFKITLRVEATRWNQYAHLLFVDQPFGAGFSYSNDNNHIVNSTEDAANTFIEFLTKFFNHYPRLKANKFYIFGESFAGHYIPAIGAKIVASGLNINFVGVGIGDGWTAPLTQVSKSIDCELTSYGSFLYSAGIIDDFRRKEWFVNQTAAQNSIINNDYDNARYLFDQMSGDVFEAVSGGVSPYNFWQYPDSASSTEPYEAFLNLNKDTFNAQKTYGECNETIYDNFTDIANSREADIVTLLNSKIHVLLYNGQLDYIVNTAGAQMWINQMSWSQISQWKAQNKQLFKVSNKVVGWLKQYQNFIFVNIYQAGHMVPSDQGVATTQMLLHYLNGDKNWV